MSSFAKIGLLLPLLFCRATAATAANQPSILLVTIDTLRADHVNSRFTPALARLQQEALTFDQAFTVSPLTLPAHASLLTGLQPMGHGLRDNSIYSLSPQTPTFAASFQKKGYATAAFVSSGVLDSRFGLDAGFDVYDDDISGVERPAEQTLGAAAVWLDWQKKPFFVWVHLFEPHAPYTGSYEDEVRTVDSQLGKFFQTLQTRGIWDDLIVAVTADHGESLGEHGEKTHGYFVYDATLKIPWILKVPGLGNRHYPYPVRIVDVLPTIVQALPKTASSREQTLQTHGKGLLSLIEKNEDADLAIYSETFLPLHQFHWSALKSLHFREWKFIQAPVPELYDLKSDPFEKNNLAAQNRSMLAALEQRLQRLEQRYQGPTRESASKEVLAEKFMSIGYIGYSPPLEKSSPSALPDPKDKLPVYLLVMEALELSESGKAERSLEALTRAEKMDPDVAQLYFLKGAVLAGLGRFLQAVESFERTLALNPRYAAASLQLAAAALRAGLPKKAEAVLQRVLSQEPDNFRAHHVLAVIALNRQDWAAAENLEKKAIGLNADYFDAWNTLGAIYINQKKPQAAIEALQRALEIQPGSGQAFYNLSLAQRSAGDAAAATRAADQACALDSRFCSGKK